MHKKFDKSSNSNRKFPNKEDILKLEPSVEQIEEVKELIEQVDVEHYFANSNIIFKDELIDSNKNEDKKQEEIFQLLMFINKMAEEAVKRLS